MQCCHLHKLLAGSFSACSASRGLASAAQRTTPATPLSLFSALQDSTLRLERSFDSRETTRSIGYQPRIRALLVDAAGTLISPSEPAAQVYLRHAAPYGCTLTELQILENFRRAFNEPWTQSTLRYEGDARCFWRHIVGQATGCDHDAMHAAVYDYFARAEAWRVMPGAVQALQEIRAAGFKLAVVSNFDTRLRQILDEMQLTQLFDAVVVSAEVGVEKPNPIIFEAACARLGVAGHETLVLGDDRRNDITGSRDAGCHAWLFQVDVLDFREVASRLISGQIF